MSRVNCDFRDYQQAFALDELKGKRVIEFDAGCNSAKAEQPAAHWTSCDPHYGLPLAELRGWSSTQTSALSASYSAHPQRFSWRRFKDFAELLAHDQAVAAKFFQDYEKNPSHYLAHTLSQHGFTKNSFDVVLLHYFFSRAGLNLEQLFAEIQQALSLAPEVRIFPLLDDVEQASPWLAPLLLILQQNEIGVELRQMNYEWQVKGSVLLILKSQACLLDN